MVRQVFRCANACSQTARTDVISLLACYLGNFSCSLASLKLMKFPRGDDAGNQAFDAGRFASVVVLVTAMDISICFADFPTEKIGGTTRAVRRFGIGYANLGALLMATGHACDSDGGRALAVGRCSTGRPPFCPMGSSTHGRCWG